MTKVGCLGCVMVLDCMLPKFCGNRIAPDPKIRKRFEEWLHSSEKTEAS
jgi:hypothetical protein